MNLKKLSGEHIAIIALVASGLLIVAAGYLLLVSPQQSHSSSLSGQIATAQTEMIVAKGASAKPVPFRASDLFSLARAMPASVDMPDLILELDHIASLSALQVTSVHPSPQVPLALGYSAVPLAITVSGSYRAISKFEELLRTSVRIAPNTLRVNGRLFDTDEITLAPATTSTTSSTTSSGSAQGTSGSASSTKPKPPSNDLSASLNLDAFVYGGPPPVTATAGQALSSSTTTTTSGGA